MSEVNSNRSIWKDLFLWWAVVQIASFIVSLLLNKIPIVGIVLGIGISGLAGLGFFVYMVIYLNALVKDLNVVCEHALDDEEENSYNYLAVWALSLVTLGTYRMYWLYKQGNRLHNALEEYGIKSSDTGVTYIIFNIPIFAGIFGAFVSGYLFFKNLNKACRAYENGGSKRNRQQFEENGANVGRENVGFEREETMSVPVIVGTRGEYAGQELDIPFGESIVLGRDAQRANLVFSSEKISKIHCKITFNTSENCFYVTDYSRNGVFTDGKRRLTSGKPERLNRGSKLILSDTEELLLR